MRIAIPAALVVAALSLSANHASASEGPWCAVISLGPGAIYEDCQYRTFEQCRPVVLAGNRGFCNINPRWVAPPPTKSRHRRHAQSY
jgi:Protein of unknown function (DUF3551)